MKRNRIAKCAVRALALASLLVVALPTLAMAEEGAGSGLALLIPNMVEFIPMLIAFVILWIFFAKFAYPKIMEIINKRAQTIEDDLKEAEASKIEGARLFDERRRMLDEARQEAARIIADAKKSADALRAKSEEEARAQAQAIIDKANATVEAQRAQTAEDLQRSMADISVAVAGKLIGQDLSDEEHRAIIERYVQEAGSLNAG